MNRIKAVIGLSVVLITSYIGRNTYQYFFDTAFPVVAIEGIEESGYYAGDMHCIVQGSDSYKVADFAVWLDGKPFIQKTKVSSRSFERPFVVATQELSNDKHSIKVEVTDGTHAGHKTQKQIEFGVDNKPLQAAFVKSEAPKVFQGRTLHLQFQVNKKIKGARMHALDSSFVCFQEAKNSLVYECFISITCEETPNEYMIKAEIEDFVGNKQMLEDKFQVVSFPFKKSILRVDAEKMKKEKEIGLSNIEFEQELQELASRSPQEKLWHGTFYPPIEIQRVSTEFGVVRTTQEKGRYVHKAVDVLNAPRSVVWAPQDGVVVMKNRYVNSGNTVVIDHGFGIVSMFFHLEEFNEKIEVGSIIKRGNPLGTLGMTGYASGYHLHWEMRINNIAIDPMQWTNQHF